MATPFISHMTMNEAQQLQVGDKIDHRDNAGRFYIAEIIKKKNNNLKIHYIDWDKKFFVRRDPTKKLHEFAKFGSISKRKRHRFMELAVGDHIDVNYNGWNSAEIQRFDGVGGQIQVAINSDDDKCILRWFHIDNIGEVASFGSKTTNYTKKRKLNENSNSSQSSSKKRRKISYDPFVPHMSLESVKELKVGDKIDHKGYRGKFCPALIVKIRKTRMKIHYKGWNERWDVWSNYKKELYRFATYQSISKRPGHRLNDIKKGDEIEVNIPGLDAWKVAKVDDFDKVSGQIQIKMKGNDKQKRFYWIHVDNTKEIRYKTKGILRKEMSGKKVADWNCDEVIYWLNRVDNGRLNGSKYGMLRTQIKSGNIKGNELMNINDTTLKAMGVLSGNDRKMILKYIGDLVGKDGNKETDAIHVNYDSFCDPITCEIMKDPVLVTVSGTTYERQVIEEYVKENGKDPITLQKVEMEDIVPNRALKDSIDMFMKQRKDS